MPEAPNWQPSPTQCTVSYTALAASAMPMFANDASILQGYEYGHSSETPDNTMLTDCVFKKHLVFSTNKRVS